MTTTEKLAKAARIQAKLVSEKSMDKDFAEAMSLRMVLTGDYSIKRNRMPVWLAGPQGADTFRKLLAES